MTRGTASAMVIAMILALACLCSAGGSKAEPASAVPAEEFVQSIGNRAVELLETCDDGQGRFDEASLKTLIRSGFDIEVIGRFVLGKHLRTASPHQLRDFSQAYSRFFVDNNAERLCTFRGEFITVLGSRSIDARDTLVETQIDRAGQVIKAIWRVRTKGGTYKVIDLSFDGVSMALSQREEFAAIITSSGMTGLMDVLRVKGKKIRPSLVEGETQSLMPAALRQPASDPATRLSPRDR